MQSSATSPPVVYVVSSGARYEGGSVHSVHASRESAEAAACLLLKECADELAEFRREDSWWDDPRFEYRQVRPGYWENNTDFIVIEEHSLVSI